MTADSQGGSLSRSARVLLLALSCMLALATLLSTLVLTELHDHDCAGDDCPICVVLGVAQALLSSSSAATASPLAQLVAGISFALLVLGPAARLVAETPVSRRDKLLI